MVQNSTGYDHDTVRDIIDQALVEQRRVLSLLEAKAVVEAYGIRTPEQGAASSPDEAAELARSLGFPVVMKIDSPDILHNSAAGGLLVGLCTDEAVAEGYRRVVDNALDRDSDAEITGVQVQRMLEPGQEVIIGSVTDPTFGQVVAFGLGGALADVAFRLAPVTGVEAMSMVDGIEAAGLLRGASGGEVVDRGALASMIRRVCDLVSDFPELSEVSLNPVLATASGATAVDVRMLVKADSAADRPRFSEQEVLTALNRILRPTSIAVVGASSREGEIGNSVMQNLLAGGFGGDIHPVNSETHEILGRKAFPSISEVPGDVDVVVLAVSAESVPIALDEAGAKGAAGAILIPPGFGAAGTREPQHEAVTVARKHGMRLLGPNVHGCYYTQANLSVTLGNPRDARAGVALTSESGSTGVTILGFNRSNQMGVSALVGVGETADIDEGDLLAFLAHDDSIGLIALHLEEFTDGRNFAETAKRVSQQKPVVLLKTGRADEGGRAVASRIGALAVHDEVCDDILRQCGVIRARDFNEMLEYARGVPLLPAPKGENVVVITGASGSGALLSNACADNELSLMEVPQDLDEAFRARIPPFGAAGNPIDITGCAQPETYRNTIGLGLADERVHALVLGYRHTIAIPPMMFARLVVEIVEEYLARGVHKPVVASLAGDLEAEEASSYLYERGVVAYPRTTEKPVDVLGAKYRWARSAGLLPVGPDVSSPSGR